SSREHRRPQELKAERGQADGERRDDAEHEHRGDAGAGRALRPDVDLVPAALDEHLGGALAVGLVHVHAEHVGPALEVAHLGRHLTTSFSLSSQKPSAVSGVGSGGGGGGGGVWMPNARTSLRRERKIWTSG